MNAVHRRLLILASPALLPVALAILWLASGREVFTKSARMQTVAVPNALFGGTDIQQQSIPGPVGGYYIGLDFVAIAVLIALAASLALWWATRRRLRAAPNTPH